MRPNVATKFITKWLNLTGASNGRYALGSRHQEDLVANLLHSSFLGISFAVNMYRVQCLVRRLHRLFPCRLLERERVRDGESG